jgi:ketosteroid isomerase-like protein
MEIGPPLQIILSVSASNDWLATANIMDCAAIMDFVTEDFATQMRLQTRESITETTVRLANGQQVATIKGGEVSFTIAQNEFVRTLHVLRWLRAADIVLALL